MKRSVLILFALLGCLWANTLVAASRDTAILDRIKAANEAYNTITAHFTHEKYMPIFEENIRSEGRYYYSKPDRLLMTYTDPEGDFMLISGDNFIMTAAGKKQETTAKNVKMRDMRTILSACMEGDIRKTAATEISCEETNTQYVVTAIIPAGKDNRSGIVKVVAHYDKSNGSIDMLRTEEADGTSNTYRLDGKQLNQAIKEETFNL